MNEGSREKLSEVFYIDNYFLRGIEKQTFVCFQVKLLVMQSRHPYIVTPASTMLGGIS
jgi:hypothetical protein